MIEASADLFTLLSFPCWLNLLELQLPQAQATDFPLVRYCRTPLERMLVNLQRMLLALVLYHCQSAEVESKRHHYRWERSHVVLVTYCGLSLPVGKK